MEKIFRLEIRNDLISSNGNISCLESPDKKIIATIDCDY